MRKFKFTPFPLSVAAWGPLQHGRQLVLRCLHVVVCLTERTLLNRMLSVYTKALMVDEAEQHIDKYYSSSVANSGAVARTPHTYRHLTEMYVRDRDLSRALLVKDEMLGDPNVENDPEVFGLIVQKLGNLGHVEHAVEVLDEVQSLGLRVRERFV